MIEEEALVTHVEAGQIWVEKPRQSACGSCHQPCATASVADYLGKAKSRLVIDSSIELRPGDHVVLGIQEDALVKGSLAVYLSPLLGLFAGSILGKSIGFYWFAGAEDVAASLGGLLGLIAAIALLKYTRVLSRSYTPPVILRKVG